MQLFSFTPLSILLLLQCYPIKQILEEPGKQGLSTNTIAIIVIVVCAVVT
jgi:hypothetical protein